MHTFFILILLSVISLNAFTRNIKPGGLSYSASLNVGWQDSEIHFNGTDSIDFYSHNPETTTDSLTGRAPTLNFYSGPIYNLRLAAHIGAQELKISLALIDHTLSYPKQNVTSLFYRLTFAYQYTFLQDWIVSPFISPGIGFHRITVDKGFHDVMGEKRNFTLTGKHYQIETGIEYPLFIHLSLTSSALYRWTNYQNFGVGTKTSYELNIWGRELSGMIGVKIHF
ncbi:MAG: hypothetical protein OCC49_02955 [Fibrobacterales bacterium]